MRIIDLNIINDLWQLLTSLDYLERQVDHVGTSRQALSLKDSALKVSP